MKEEGPGSTPRSGHSFLFLQGCSGTTRGGQDGTGQDGHRSGTGRLGTGHNAKITSLILLEYLGTRRDSVTGTINLDIAQSLKTEGT